MAAAHTTAYDEGRAAWLRGRCVTGNPYPVGSDAHRAWGAGWQDAEDEENNA